MVGEISVPTICTLGFTKRLSFSCVSIADIAIENGSCPDDDAADHIFTGRPLLINSGKSLACKYSNGYTSRNHNVSFVVIASITSLRKSRANIVIDFCTSSVKLAILCFANSGNKRLLTKYCLFCPNTIPH